MTALLLDSHVVVWLMDGSPRLRQGARETISSAATVFCSTASLWELTIKQSKGKLQLPPGFIDAVLATGLAELSVSSAHVAAIAPESLPHRDPFDHILLAQARVEGLRLLTADAAILAAGLPFVVDARQ